MAAGTKALRVNPERTEKISLVSEKFEKATISEWLVDSCRSSGTASNQLSQ